MRFFIFQSDRAGRAPFLLNRSGDAFVIQDTHNIPRRRPGQWQSPVQEFRLRVRTEATEAWLAKQGLQLGEGSAIKHGHFDREMLRKSCTRRATINVRGTLAFFLVTLMTGLAAIEAGAEPASAPAGFYRVDCLGNSDTIVSIPFTQPEAAFALVESVAGSVVTVMGTPGWLVDQFVYVSGTQSNSYYARLLSGQKEGGYYPIVGNDIKSLTLSLGGDDFSSVTNGTRLSVIPYWTLATAFPQGKGVIASSNAFNPMTEILIPDFAGVGVNLNIHATYYFFTNGTWRLFGAGTANKNDDILLPDVYFIVRHNISSNTVFTAQGSVAVSKLAIPLMTQVQPTNQDNFIALSRPATVTLNESGLFQSSAFLASPNAFNPTDELLTFDNSTIGKNKTVAATYYYRNDAWRKSGDLTGDYGNEPVFVPATGVIIRKKATSDGASTNWINSATY